MKPALVHVVMDQASFAERRPGPLLRPVLFALAAALLGGGAFYAFDALSAGVTAPESWRALAHSEGKQDAGDAVPAGQEGELRLYACRATINKDVHVGRIRQDFAGCHIGFDGKETEVAPFEALAATWRPGTEAMQAATPAGSERSISAEGGFEVANLYICRAAYQGGIHTGQARSGEKGCSFGFGGKRIVASSYEVLQKAPWMTWALVTARNLPETAIVSGSEGGEPFFACRAADRQGLHPGKIKRNAMGCSIVSDGHEAIVERFEVLVSRWLAGRNGSVPVPAVPVGWEGSTLQFACRAQTRDSVQVGKVSEALGGCHVGMLGREVVLSDYEVLSQ